MKQNWQRAISKGRMTAEQQAEYESRLVMTTDLSRLAEADFVIEAVTEILN